MLTASDMATAAKIVVQLGFVAADAVRAELRALDGDRTSPRDLVNRLTDGGRLNAKQIETVRHRVALYEHVRGESSYVRSLERSMRNLSKTHVAELIAGLEKNAFRRRLGEILVKQGKLTKAQDAQLVDAEREALLRDDHRVIERYRKEDFAGVAKGLIPGSKLAPEDFKISTLFRSKETRALVDRAELTDLLQTKSERVVVAKPDTETVDLAPAPSPKETAEERVRGMKRLADFSLIEVLGVGGMGAVFLGQRDGTGEFAAIKVLLDERASKDERARFQREIELTPLVKHRNVIQLLDWGTTRDGVTYLVVPALTGKELRAHLHAREKGLAPAVVLKVFRQLLAGLQALHEVGVLHRDLKPENVFVLAGGEHEVRIMDFGLAKRLNERADADVFRTVAGEIVGSPAYIAPETVQCDPVDARTDLYSLGIMLFECLCGKRPIDSLTSMGYLTAHMVAPPLTLAEADPERPWPVELEGFLGRLLGKSRDERPASARAALDELEALAPAILSLQGPAGGTPDAPVTRRILSTSLLGRL